VRRQFRRPPIFLADTCITFNHRPPMSPRLHAKSLTTAYPVSSAYSLNGCHRRYTPDWISYTFLPSNWRPADTRKQLSLSQKTRTGSLCKHWTVRTSGTISVCCSQSGNKDAHGSRLLNAGLHGTLVTLECGNNFGPTTDGSMTARSSPTAFNLVILTLFDLRVVVMPCYR
jgi:hypothetical protein